jgi:hypothetical protein
MTKHKVLTATLVHPDDKSISSTVRTGILYRPELWELRKAILKLAELYPTSPAVDMKIIITTNPFHSDDEWYDGYRDEIIPYIWFLYNWVDSNIPEKSPTDTVLLWVIRCAHYHYMHGPHPDQRRAPKHKVVVKTELWRDKLCCPVCNAFFSYPGKDVDTRELVMGNYNKWLEEHTKVCPRINWNKQVLMDKETAVRLVEEERAARAARENEAYELWKAQHADVPKITPETLLQKRHKEEIATRISKIKVAEEQGNVPNLIFLITCVVSYINMMYKEKAMPTLKSQRDEIARTAQKHGMKEVVWLQKESAK